MTDPAGRIIGLYDEKAEDWVADRGPALGRGGPVPDEATALERFAEVLPPGGTVLDVGCGSGWPWGAALLDRGFRVTGLDASPRLLAHAAATLPDGEWIVGDMRTFDLSRTFDGLLVWWSLFHLTPDDQRTAMTRILGHAAPRAALLMTAGARAGVKIGEWRGEPLYHASLSPEDYAARLSGAGFVTERWARANDLGSDFWLARRAFLSAE